MINMDMSQFGALCEELQLEINKFTSRHKLDARDVYVILKYLAYVYERNIRQQSNSGDSFINITDIWISSEKEICTTKN